MKRGTSHRTSVRTPTYRGPIVNIGRTWSRIGSDFSRVLQTQNRPPSHTHVQPATLRNQITFNWTASTTTRAVTPKSAKPATVNRERCSSTSRSAAAATITWYKTCVSTHRIVSAS
eukprot:11255811-Karenia_brevis.AAC.1